MTDRTINADGDTWTVRLGREGSSRDRRAVLFFCRTTNQRPYRVVEVAENELDGPDAFQALSKQRLGELFAASRSMGFPREYPTYAPE